MLKEQQHTLILDIMNKINCPEGQATKIKSIKSLDLSDFNDYQLDLLMEHFYPSNASFFNDEIIKRKELKLKDTFAVKIKSMNLNQLSEERNRLNKIISYFDNQLVFQNDISDEQEEKYWKSLSEIDLLDKQYKQLKKQ